jgi:pyridinium-3,5-bisthiocarboxylic acid mononucleotide nickel chelatase
MTKIAYLETPTGVAGDMCLAALIHAGLPVEYLQGKLNQLGIVDQYQLRINKVLRNGQLATKVDVDLIDDHDHDHDHTHNHNHDHTHNHDHDHNHSHDDHDHDHHHTRHLPEITEMIITAKLPPQVEKWSLAIFKNLAIAEGLVHGIAPEKVHFHEVGAIDAIVDIVGTCIGLDYFQIDEIYCSPLPTGGGTVKADHGILPVPVPAVLKLWELHQVPVYNNNIKKELVTPTGSAITATLAKEFGASPNMQIKNVGLGAGNHDLPIPNILRLWIGEKTTSLAKTSILDDDQLETITVLETQIDDLNPQAIAYIFEQLFLVGALDVFTQPIMMKKSRLGTLLTVICHPEKVARCENVIFQETSTLGIRRSEQKRSILPREIQTINTEYGAVRVKIAWRQINGNKVITNIQPEYEDCAAIARKNQIPWREIHQKVLEKAKMSVI